MKNLIQVDCGYFCAGIVVEFSPDNEDGLVVEAAPIMKWAIGKDFRAVTKFVHKRRGQWRLIREDGEALEMDYGKTL